jgi:hypothetical protein
VTPTTAPGTTHLAGLRVGPPGGHPRAAGFGDLESVLAHARERSAGSDAGAWFRIGDQHLHLGSRRDGFADEFEARYRGCTIAPPSPSSLATIRCEAAPLVGSLLCLTFEGVRLPDLLRAAGTPFRMLRHLECVEVPGPLPGWRMLLERDGGAPVVASDGRRLVVDLAVAPPEFGTDCIASVAQAAQPEVMFLHAASFGVAGSGALLIAGGRGGKSTTALALAERGHAFLGDDMAAVRTRTCELLPFRKVASLRPGAYVRSFEGRFLSTPHMVAVGPDGEARMLVHMADMFPASAGPELPLRYAFLLDGFGARPRLSPDRPDIGDVRRLRVAVSESLPLWGTSPGRDLMRFLTMVHLLSRLDCYLLELGSPRQSAAAIESAMEAICH